MGANLSYPEVNLSGRTAVVTGANTGIGYETAKALARLGCRVIIGCRSKDRAEAAIERMRAELPDKSLEISFAKLDLSSLASTQEFAQEFTSQNEHLHLLVLNAGIAIVPYGTTADGFETHFQVNYLSHFLLLLLLLPLVQRSPDPRVILVSSKAHTFGKFDLQNIQGERHYSAFTFYGHSKLYQLLSAFKLSSLLPDSGIAFLTVHPGQVKTEIQRNLQGFWKAYTAVADTVGALRSPANGAATTIFAAVSPELAGRQSLYLDSCKVVQPSSTSRNKRFQDSLWNYSLGLVRDYLTGDAAAFVKVDWQSVEAFWEAEKLQKPQTQPQGSEGRENREAHESAQETGELASAAPDKSTQPSDDLGKGNEKVEKNEAEEKGEAAGPSDALERQEPAVSSKVSNLQEDVTPAEVQESQEPSEDTKEPS